MGVCLFRPFVGEGVQQFFFKILLLNFPGVFGTWKGWQVVVDICYTGGQPFHGNLVKFILRPVHGSLLLAQHISR